jgi:hypothetical protein
VLHHGAGKTGERFYELFRCPRLKNPEERYHASPKNGHAKTIADHKGDSERNKVETQAPDRAFRLSNEQHAGPDHVNECPALGIQACTRTGLFSRSGNSFAGVQVLESFCGYSAGNSDRR